MRLLNLGLLSLISLSSAMAQTPVAEMPLPDVAADGFYKVEIPPEYSEYFSANFSNVRISDGSRYEVPYITEQAVEDARSQFTPYEVVSKEQRKGC